MFTHTQVKFEIKSLASFSAINAKVLDKDPNSTTVIQVRGGGSKTFCDSNRHFVNVGLRLASRIEVKPDDNPLWHLNNSGEDTVFQFKHVNEI